MLFLITCRISNYLTRMFDGFFVLADGQKHLLDLVLIEVDVRVDGDVLDDVALHLEGILGFSLRLRNIGHRFWLISTAHRLYYLAKNYIKGSISSSTNYQLIYTVRWSELSWCYHFNLLFINKYFWHLILNPSIYSPYQELFIYLIVIKSTNGELA